LDSRSPGPLDTVSSSVEALAFLPSHLGPDRPEHTADLAQKCPELKLPLEIISTDLIVSKN
jgi:hypothetical protein